MSVRLRASLMFLLATACLPLPATPAETPAAIAPATGAHDSLHALFDAEWQRQLDESPETASFLGVSGHGDRWSDLSFEAIAASQAATRAALQQLLSIDRAALTADDQLSYDLFRQQYEFQVEGFRFKPELQPLTPVNWDGFGYAYALVQLLPFASATDYADWIARLNAYGRLVDQNIALMKRGVRERRVPPQVIMARLTGQVARQIVAQPQDSPLYAPFARMPDAIPAPERERLQAAGAAALRDVVMPALQRFARFYERDYLPKCRRTIAATALPDGRDFYASRVREMTTTTLTPDEIHEIGLREVARIRAQMEALREQVGFTGDLPAFFEHLRSDPQFYFATGEELLAAYRALSKRVDPELVKLFGRLPRTPYGVVPVPESQAPNATTAYYQGPAEDGSRAGYYFTNLYKVETRPRWEMEALTLHEAVPGHHLQIALAQELGDLPNFRRLSNFTAFVEGWALYAERLGEDLGLYRDPYSKFGQLTYEMWRAVRLVVDTGMHSKGWTREQAIRYFVDNAAKTQNDIEVEVDRYIAWPGQALAYKVGELKIRELRERAAAVLGDGFDVRAFHDVVLGSGALPLDVLERQVEAWVDSQRTAFAAAPVLP